MARVFASFPIVTCTFSPPVPHQGSFFSLDQSYELVLPKAKTYFDFIVSRFIHKCVAN